ncbi:MAG: SAM-dependent methyltransferase [Pseudomonadota bacterium]
MTRLANDNHDVAPPEPTAMDARIREMIAMDGPMSIATYMAHCLYDPNHGYYTTGVPFGADGDFITAPDVSQMFGELIGIWCAATWQAMGSPKDFALVEMGPGRGTLMADVLRAASTVPGFNRAADIHMVEVSPRLAGLQREALSAYSEAGFRISWVERFEDVSDKPLIFVANELLDALVFQQFQKTDAGWQERLVGLDDAGDLTMVLGAGKLDEATLPGGHTDLPIGSIFERSTAREALGMALAEAVVARTGAALLIDYGNAAPGTGDTFQALERHGFVDPLTRCGVADLTSHVDFSAIYAVAQSVEGAFATPPMEQGEWLVRMGLVERARQLGQDKSAEQQARIRLDMERLAGDGDGTRAGAGAGGMGSLFKVMMIAQKGLMPPPFEDPDAKPAQYAKKDEGNV